MEPKSSLQYSQVSPTCPYSEPAPSSPHNPLPLIYKYTIADFQLKLSHETWETVLSKFFIHYLMHKWLS
jgi:hypothetical protein